VNSRFKRLSVAFLWHMHQPCYKDTITGKYLLPWVRFHAVKDYFPMAALLQGFDNVRATFNLVPSLLEQINDYALNDATDTFLDLTAKSASSLNLDDRLDILENFFRVNFKHFIEPNERYLELLIKKGLHNTSDRSLRKVVSSFSDQDMLDLQVLFNIVWFHSMSVDEDINLKDLLRKGSSYTEEDKEYVLLKQKEIISQVIPLYRKLQDAGRIEISATPFYHPIIPLLCDTSIARISMPGMDLPKKRFSHPEDARWHIEEAIKYHREMFGLAPRGMWPSEGSVSDETLEIMASNGIKWAATDEEILFKSLSLEGAKRKVSARAGRPACLDRHSMQSGRRLIYEPYKFKSGSKSLSLIFRDKPLSDIISFNYNSWEQRSAADDLMGHFRRIAGQLNLKPGADRPLVTIAMDGENAWEFFADNGRTFFETLYGHLDDDDELEAVTISGHLGLTTKRKILDTVFPASWINHNFRIWIGEDQDNVSWDYLSAVREDLVKYTKEALKKGEDSSEPLRKAWREFYIAEGSDWNWWYSGKAHMGSDNPFDKLYRTHLKNVYKYLKKEIPDFLKISIA